MKKNLIIGSWLLLLACAAQSQSISEVSFPRYIQGAGTTTNRVPFACRMTVSGLIPGATYRYYNRFVTDPANPTNTGTGNYILVKDTGSFVRVTLASLAVAGRYGEFTTNASGSYTGWFANEPGASSVFSPGAQLYFRLVLNNGAGGGAVTTLITAPNPVKVINFGTTADTLSGTGLRATPMTKGVAKQFVFLYGDLSLGDLLGVILFGNSPGRPIAGTFIESDGTANTLANGYVPFYADSVNAIEKTFGTIIPNILPSGVNLIRQYGLTDGLLKRQYPSLLGYWPGRTSLVDTKNPSGGASELVIDGSKLLSIVLWINGNRSSGKSVILQWNSYDEPNAETYVVEKSTDGFKTFSAIKTIKTNGYKESYELEDTRSEKPAFYRVIKKGKDGDITYSEVLKVTGVMKLSAYPNPVRDQDQMVVTHPEAEAGAIIEVIGANGQQLFAQRVKTGSVQTSVNVNRLVPGNYRLLFVMNGQRQSLSFIKQ